MYTTYFGFREPPFLLPPNPRFLYTTPSTQAVYTAILQGLREGTKCLLLTGEVGTGKTMLLHKLMDELAETAAIAFVYHTTFTFEEIVTAACEEFDLPTPEGDAQHKIRLLSDFAAAQSRLGKRVILFIDEAQNLQEADLVRLPSLLILPSQEESPLQLLLAGQLELEEKLQSPGLRSLRQAINCSSRLDCLPLHEVGPFIHHRLRVAGCEQQDLFASRAIYRVALHSKGLPRVINVLCDNALQSAQTHGQKNITAEIVDLAAKRILLHTDDQPSESFEPETAFTEEDAHQTAMVNPSPWFNLWLSARTAIVLGILLITFTGILLYQARSPERQFPLVHYTPATQETKREPGESSSQSALSEFSGTSSQEVTRRLPSDNPTSSLVQETASSLSPSAPKHSASPEKPTQNQPVTPSLLSSPGRIQKTKPTVAPQPKQKSPLIGAALTLQTPVVTPPRPATPRYRPLSNNEHALFQAVVQSNRQTVNHLLAEGVSPNVKSRGGWTPLMWAVIDGDITLVQALLDKGASVNVGNNRGVTPLMYAAWNGHVDILQLLLDKGADAHARDRDGATALQYARDPIARFTRTAERPRIEKLLVDALSKTGSTTSRNVVDDTLGMSNLP